MNQTRYLFKVMLASVGLAVFGNPSGARAAIANVLVGSGGNVFTPVTTNIAVNDQVLWTWAGVNHNVTSTNSAWVASPTQNTGKTFTNTFTAAGTYFYFCTIHGTATTGMKGAIIVTAPNSPPTVSITNPAAGTVFAAPANVTIRAAATDDGTVTNVQFRVDSILLTNDNTAPYAAVTNNLAVGSHTLAAIASDNNGATSTNQVTISVVTPVSVLLSAPQPVPPGKFRFTYAANAGLSYVVQRSTNLVSLNWTALATNLAGGSSINFTDLNAAFNPGYYRVGRLPNP
jgi:plastocyanin